MVEALCLALIALAAGSELDLLQLHKQRRAVTSVAAGVALSTWLLVFAGFIAAAPWLHLPSLGGGAASRRRDCHFDDAPFLSPLKHLIKVEGGAAE